MKNIFLGLTLSLLLALPFSLEVHAQNNAPTGMNAPKTFANLAEKLSPAVVNISSTQKIEERDENMPEFPQFPPGSPFEDFFEEFMGRPNGNGGGMPSIPPSSLGSGFVIDAEKGYIVTNNHVIRDAEEVRVTFHDDSTLKAKIIGRDEKVDIAVLQVETKKNLSAVDFGNSTSMRVGDWVLAIGNPFGLGGTVTAGIISARQRDINSGPYDDYLQTDASINRGNSGGPMFNLNGDVIGINTAIFSPSGGSVGIGFAIPSDLAKPIINQLIEFGRTRRGWLGVRIQTVTDEIAESLGLDKARGALVASVTKGGPAEAAKLKAGDIITEFNGRAISEMRELPRIVAETPIEKQTTLKYWRDGKEQTAKVTIGELEKAEEDGLLASNDNNPATNVKDTDIESVGMNVASITNTLRESYNINDDVNGVVVTKTDPRGEAASKGIDSGDVIIEINQQAVAEPSQVADIISKAKKDKRSSVLLLIEREGDVRFIALRLDEKD
ncbi:MAG: DegQ family serine endoprotease [Pseudomonadota bacterium]